MPFFSRLPQYSQINEQCISPYFPPGSDVNLKRLAARHQAKYMMSTSTITSLLSHLYYMIANFKSPHFSGLSKAYDNEPLKFMVSQRKPNTVFLRQLKTEDSRELYAIDSDAGFGEPSNTVLLKMGKYMEKMFTTDADYFNDYYVLDLNTNKPRIDMTPEMIEELREEDYFRYMMVGKMFLRSQIDCRGQDEEGNPIVFELKTRATAPLRYDIANYIDFLDYSIIKCKGQHSSFEREFYDLVRGGFLKYIMQMKIGRMQGAAIAYHNTQKVFGFEYIKLEQMENRVFGCSEFSDVVFDKSLAMLEKIFDHILEDQYVMEEANSGSDSNQKVFRIGFYASESQRTLEVMVEIFENDVLYQARYADQFRPEYMKDPIDFYLMNKIVPKVVKYNVGIYPVLNGLFVDHSPILYETGDHLDVKYTI